MLPTHVQTDLRLDSDILFLLFQRSNDVHSVELRRWNRDSRLEHHTHFLRKKYEIDKREEGMLSSEELAVAHAFTIMLEECTTQIGFYYRFGLHMREFSSAVNPPDWFFTFRGDNGVKTWFVGEIWTLIMQHVFRKKPTWLPYRRHSDEEKWKFSCDVKSISYYFGEKILRWRCFL